MEHSDQNHSFKVNSSMKLYQQVISQIRDLILRGVYHKGDYLPSEQALSEMMGVSRITVREALRRLNASGVIATQRGKGSLVQLDADDFMLNHAEGENYRLSFLQATDARMLLEPSLAASLVKTVDDDAIKRLERCFEEGQAPSAFHATLVELIGNPVVSRWFSETVELETVPMMTRMIPPAKQQRVSAMLERQHRKVFEAICTGREDKAFQCMLEHLKYIRRIYEDYFNTYF